MVRKINSPIDVYPKWILSVEQIQPISAEGKQPLWVSAVKSSTTTLLDVRLYIGEMPTKQGVMLSRKACEKLIGIMHDFLAGEIPPVNPGDNTTE